MRLLVVIASYPPHQMGGYEIRCHDVVEALKQRGHDVLVVTTRCPRLPCTCPSEQPSVRRKLHRKSDAPNVLFQILNDCKDIRYLHGVVEAFRPDIVYLWAIQTMSNAILPYFAHLDYPIVYDEGGVELVYLAKIQRRGIYFYNNPSDNILKKSLKYGIYTFAKLVSLSLIRPDWAWPYSMGVYFNSYSSLRYAQDQGVPVQNAAVIHSGVDISRFPYVPRRQAELPVNIVVVGRIKPDKGSKDGIRLALELVTRGIPVRLKFAGTVQSQDYFLEMKRFVRENELASIVEFAPMTPFMWASLLYHSASICFFPSYCKHGFSRVPLEAMACGCLVISYGNEGSSEVIKNGETGFLVPEGDVVSAASAIVEMIEQPDHYRAITARARRQIEEAYTLEHYVNAIDHFLITNWKKGVPSESRIY